MIVDSLRIFGSSADAFIALELFLIAKNIMSVAMRKVPVVAVVGVVVSVLTVLTVGVVNVVGEVVVAVERCSVVSVVATGVLTVVCDSVVNVVGVVVVPEMHIYTCLLYTSDAADE